MGYCLHSRLSNDQNEYVDSRGVHVVVGHYLGEDSLNGQPPNITDGKIIVVKISF